MEIYNLINNKIYEYVKDYVIAALALNVIDPFIDIHNYLENKGEDFELTQLEQIFQYLKIEDIKIEFESTCDNIPELFIEIYNDIINKLSELYRLPFIHNYLIGSVASQCIKENLLSILIDDKHLFYSELYELELIIDRVRVLVPKLNYSIVFHEKYKSQELSYLIMKFTDAWGNFIHKYHVIISMYLDNIYPKQVEAIYEFLTNTLSKDLFNLLEKLNNNKVDLSKAYITLDNYFFTLMEQ
jgi:hypothetical protein